MPDALYMAVTPDIMELPIAVGDSLTDLADVMRMSVSALSRNYKRCRDRRVCEKRHCNEFYRVRRVDMEE